MGKISKGFGSAIAVLGILCLIFGICISVISWVLASKTPTSISYSEDGVWEDPIQFTHIGGEDLV